MISISSIYIVTDTQQPNISLINFDMLSKITRPIKIWNGFEWSYITITPSIESKSDNLIIQTIDNFGEIWATICSANHPFIMFDGKLLHARELKEGFELRDWHSPITHNTISNTIMGITPYNEPTQMYDLQDEIARSCVVNNMLIGTNF